MDSLGSCLLLSLLIMMNLWLSCSAGKRIRTRVVVPFWEKPSWDRYYKTEKNKSDFKSVPFQRKNLLYSRASAGHIRILGTKVDGKGSSTDPHAKLVFQSVTFGRVTIRGLKTGRSLCMNKHGKLVGRTKVGVREKRKKCMFKEILSKGTGYKMLESVKYRGWFIAINKKGRVVKGSLSTRGKKSRFFMPSNYNRSISGRSPSSRRRMKRLRLRMRRTGLKDKLKKIMS